MGKRNGILFLLVSLLLLYFLAQTATDAFLSFHDPDDAKGEWLRRAALLHPLDAEPHLRMGHAFLERGKSEGNPDFLRQAVAHLKRAIRLNPFVYQAHLNLGQAYFLLSEKDPQWVSEGVVSFKRAATIRGANLSVAVSTSKLLFSLWPLLKTEDQDFARELVAGVMRRISRQDFEGLVDLWALYNRKIEIMEEFISQRPEFSGLVAGALARNRQYLEQRRRLLNTADQVRYQGIKVKVEEELNQPLENQDTKAMLRLFGELGQVYRGYDRLLEKELFPDKSRLALRRRLGERLMGLLMDSEGKWRTPALRQPVDLVAGELIRDSRESENAQELELFLDKSRYYLEGDLKSFLARQRILYQTARYDQVIDQIETLQRQLSFVREDARPDMIEALFLLCDAYRSSRLLTMAVKVLDSLEALSPPPERLLWQRYLVEKVIGVQADADMLESWRGRFAASRSLTLEKKSEKRTIYLDENRDITVTLSPELWAKGEEGSVNLIELTLDGRVLWDAYFGEENAFLFTFPQEFEGRAVEVEIGVK